MRAAAGSPPSGPPVSQWPYKRGVQTSAINGLPIEADGPASANRNSLMLISNVPPLDAQAHRSDQEP